MLRTVSRNTLKIAYRESETNVSADLRCRDAQQNSAFHLAAAYDRVDVIKNDLGYTVLDIAKQNAGPVYSYLSSRLQPVATPPDLGMNLVTEKWQAAGQGSPACLPCYAYKMPKGWIFSDLAVKALQDYREKFPGVFEALRSRRTTNQRQIKDLQSLQTQQLFFFRSDIRVFVYPGNIGQRPLCKENAADGSRPKDLEQRAIFPDRADKDYCSRQLVKYCNSCEWKRLKLAPTQYMALTAQSVSQVACSVDEALRCRRKEDVESLFLEIERHPNPLDGGLWRSDCCQLSDVTTVGADSLCRTEEAFQVPAALRMPSGEDLAVGQRGVYTNPHGAVPCGVQGTVIGIYGTGETQQIEVLLDEERV
eukprot:s750_g3.t1